MPFIDFINSDFYITEMLGAPIMDIELKNQQEFMTIRKKVSNGEMDGIEEFSSLDLKKVVFKRNTKTPDFFTLSGCGTTMFITQRLYDKINEAGLKGFELTSTRRIVIEE